MKRRIVCSANRSGLTVVLGVRHFDDVMQSQIRQLDGPCNSIDWSRSEQGFIDNDGKFLDRHKAWKVAYPGGQVVRRCGGDNANGGTLYSENLY